jgi:hypothetical protein
VAFFFLKTSLSCLHLGEGLPALGRGLMGMATLALSVAALCTV